MNPAVAAAGVKALEKIDFNKVFMALGAILLTLVIIIGVRRYRKKNKSEKINEDLLESVGLNIDVSKLSYDTSWYDAKAMILAADLDAPFGGNGGWLGCNQKGVYDLMKMMKSKDDVEMLVKAFGERELNASWLQRKKLMTLPDAISKLMTNGERREINKILNENGIYDSSLNSSDQKENKK